MLRIENINYKWDKSEKNTLNNINFSLEQGEILCLCGPNGSGKSTLLQILAGLELAQGEYQLADIAASSKSLAQIRQKSALLMQDPNLQILGYTTLEDVLLPYPNPSATQIAKAKELLKLFSLPEEAFTQSLSHGQKRKLCLADALMTDPSLILLDEPLAGLDYPAILELRKIIQTNKKLAKTQVVSSHELEALIDIVDKVLILVNGEQLLFAETKEALFFLQKHPECGIRIPCAWQNNQSIAAYE